MNRSSSMMVRGVLAAVLLAAAPARAEDKVQFRLNWILYGFHTPFYLGLERGYYKDEGIELTIGEGQGSVRAVQTVGAKGDTFGLSDGGSVIAGVSKGAPVKSVMAITNSSPYAVTARNDVGIKTLKDLEGKTIASAPGEAGLAIKDPDASIKAGQKVKPDLDTALSLAQLKVGIGLIKSPASKDLPPGQFAAKDWADTVELMKT